MIDQPAAPVRSLAATYLLWMSGSPMMGTGSGFVLYALVSTGIAAAIVDRSA